MTEVAEIEGTDLLGAIDLANTIRSIGGFPKIDDLVAGMPNNPENCVLANTFNCDCEVRGPDTGIKVIATEDDPHPWFAYFEDRKYADALAKELHIDVEVSEAPDSSTCIYAVQLPPLVGEIARLFDDDILPEKYYLGREEEWPTE